MIKDQIVLCRFVKRLEKKIPDPRKRSKESFQALANATSDTLIRLITC